MARYRFVVFLLALLPFIGLFDASRAMLIRCTGEQRKSIDCSPRCGFARREVPGSACRTSSEDLPSPPEGGVSVGEARPVIDAPVISAFPSSTAEVVPTDAPQYGSGGRHSSDRTLSGSAARRVRTPTPLAPSLGGAVAEDKREVTQHVHGSSSQTWSPHPPPYPSTASVPTTVWGSKRQRVSQEGLPDDFKKMIHTVCEQHARDLTRVAQVTTERVEDKVKRRMEMDRVRIESLEAELVRVQ